MRLIPIIYNYEKGPIKEEDQKVVEVTQDLIDIIESGKSIMLRKIGDKVVIMIDSSKWNFRQR